MADHQQEENGLLIPVEKLSADVLSALIEAYILREGTDYGLHEVSLEEKKHQVYKQIQKKEVVILFDPNTESVNLVPEKDFKNLNL